MPAPSNKKKTGKTKPASNFPAIPAQPAEPLTTTTAPNEANPAFDFAFFIENASDNDIRDFLDTAATTYEGRNLKILFVHAYKAGKDTGYKIGKEVGYREGEEDGYCSGYNEGYVEGRDFDDEAALEELHQIVGYKPPAAESNTEPAQDPVLTTHVDSSTQTDESQLQIYTRKEVQDLVDEAHLDGWQTGFEDGRKSWQYTKYTDSTTQTCPHVVVIAESGTQNSHHTSTAIKNELPQVAAMSQSRKSATFNEKHLETLEITPQHPPQPLATYNDPTSSKKVTPVDLYIKIDDTNPHSPESPETTPERPILTSLVHRTPTSSLATIQAFGNPPSLSVSVPAPSITPSSPKSPKIAQNRSFSLPRRSPTPTSSPAVTQTPSLSPSAPNPAVSRTPARFDWSDDVASLPAVPRMFQDLSVLKTGHSQPFRTLKKQTQRQRAPPYRFWLSTRPFLCNKSPPPIQYTQPAAFIPPVPSSPPPKLNWSTHPRLLALSRTLCTLGWAPAI